MNGEREEEETVLHTLDRVQCVQVYARAREISTPVNERFASWRSTAGDDEDDDDDDEQCAMFISSSSTSLLFVHA